MAYYKIKFRLASNEDWREQFTLKNPDGTPLDLAGVSDMRMQVRDRKNSLKLDLGIDTGLVINDAAEGDFMLDVDVSTIASIPAGLYFHDLVLTRNGLTEQLWQGEVEIIKGITQ